MKLTRRSILGAAAASAAALLSKQPGGAAQSSGKLIIRSDGGAYEEAERKAIYDPFTAATGIQIQTIPSTAAQVVAMVQSGSVQLDVLDLGESQMLLLDKKGALAPIDYADFKLTNPGDLIPSIKRDRMVGNIYFATVMGYSTRAFAGSAHPKNWRDFWDTAKFAGPRTLPDVSSGAAPLEFALLADGVPMGKLYPLDVQRAFRSLSRIKAHVVKWWTTGAESIELLEGGEALGAALWNGRIQGPVDKGAPLAIEWNQSMRQRQFWGIIKGAPNIENAQRFVDFALQPRIQAELAKYIPYGPTNKKAFQYINKADAAKLPSSPEHYAVSFDQDAQWWVDHLQDVTVAWQKWLISG